MGAAGPVWLGASRVVLVPAGQPTFGTVVSFCRPWFEVRLDAGQILKMRGRELAGCLIFQPADFFNPLLFHFDFGDLNPLRVPGWVSGLLDYLSEHRAVVPSVWLDREAPAPSGGSVGDFASFIAAEKASLQAYLLGLAGEARASSTLAHLRHPALKALWWLASRGRPLPPAGDDVAEYLAYLARTQDTIGSVECASNALGYLCVVNGWDKESIMGGKARIPVAAIRRRHVHVIHKAAGLTETHIRAIMRVFCVVHMDLPWFKQWHLAVGIGVGCLPFKILARYDDVSQLRYDPGYFAVTPHLIDLKCDTRKNSMEHSTTLSVARPADPHEIGVYHMLLKGFEVFRGGYILPHIDAHGTVHRERPMQYADFVRFLRFCLVFAVGMSEEEASHFAGHSARAGGGTAAARAGLPPHQICHLAGVRDINWLLTYMRSSLEDRLRASWSLGL